MDQSDGIWFACPECGASNRSDRNFCSQCGHGLVVAGPETVTGIPGPLASPASPEPFNPYSPPTTSELSPFSFQISSLLMVIAVIAVCLGVARLNVVLGIVSAVAAVPALIYTVIVAARRKGNGVSMTVRDKVETFLIAIAGVYAIVTSVIVAFLTTCIPVAYVTTGSGVALVIGGIAAAAAGAFMIYLLLFRKRRNRWIAGKP